MIEMKDTLTAQCLLESATNYFEAKREHDKARDEYIEGGGYSWGYFGHSYVMKMESAAEDFKSTFEKLVKQALTQ